jgi:hypothetical protein
MHALDMQRDEWTIPRAAVDERAYDGGRAGSFRLGPRIRRSAFGEVLRALPDGRGAVVEVELLAALAPIASPEAELMLDLASVAALRHRHLIPLIGAGLDEGMPYVVRPHRMGRTLAELLEEADGLSAPSAAALLHAVADAIGALQEDGQARMGGFDPRDVFLSYDGSIGLVGLGLEKARGAEDPDAADLESCFALARLLEKNAPGARLPSAIAGARSPREIERAVRRRYPEACAYAAQHVAHDLRASFALAISEERAKFGLPTLQ